MASFKQVRSKIQRTYEQNRNHELEQERKINDLKKKFLISNLISTYRLIKEFDFTIVPFQSVSVRHTEIGTPLPSVLSYDYQAEYQIDRDLLAFLNYDFNVKADPNKTLAGVMKYKVDDWYLSYAIVKGDGSLIFQGFPSTFSLGTKATQTMIDDGSVLSSHTKQAWQTTIYWTESGDLFRIINGEIISFKTARYDESIGCSGGENFSYIEGQLYPSSGQEGSDLYKNGKITAINVSSVNLIGQRYRVDWLDPGSGCVANEVYTENVSGTFAMSDMTITVQGVRQKWNGSTYVNFPSGIGGYPVDCSTINTSLTQFFTANFWLFYDTGLRWRFGFNTASGPSQFELVNIPFKDLGSSVVLPYSTITHEMNKDPYPQKTSDFTGVEATEVQATSYGNPAYFRMSKSIDAQEIYKVNFPFRGLIVAPANNNTMNRTYKVFDDVWSVQSLDYDRTTESHTEKLKKVYQSELSDVVVNLKVGIKNPFYWREVKKYRREDTDG